MVRTSIIVVAMMLRFGLIAIAIGAIGIAIEAGTQSAQAFRASAAVAMTTPKVMTTAEATKTLAATVAAASNP